MAMTRRTERVNELIREEISQVLSRQVRDPRLGGFVTVTEVSVTPDLRYAKVFVSIMGSEDEKKAALTALAAASGFFHRELRKHLALHHIPELSFHEDSSIERGGHILNLIKQVTSCHSDPERSEGEESG
jgi:ribosome-binding factor A